MTLDRRALAGGVRALVAPAAESDGFLVAVTERGGGASAPPFNSLNLGYLTGDRPDAVTANRRAAASSIGIERFAAARQVHGARIVEIGDQGAGAGFGPPPTPLGDADAVAVSSPGVAVAVLVADCVPVAIASPVEGRLVVVHAGWRGLAAGIVGRAASTFDRPADARAVVGPAIGPCHYEVGREVVDAVDAGAGADAVVRRAGGTWFLDLPSSVAAALEAAGVRRVERADECTACHPDRFFSHRRDGTTGRQAMIAMRR